MIAISFALQAKGFWLHIFYSFTPPFLMVLGGPTSEARQCNNVAVQCDLSVTFQTFQETNTWDNTCDLSQSSRLNYLFVSGIKSKLCCHFTVFIWLSLIFLVHIFRNLFLLIILNDTCFTDKHSLENVVKKLKFKFMVLVIISLYF